MNTVIAVAVGGALGSMARYVMNAQVTKLMGFNFPWGIMSVNILGCFIMGLVAEGLALHFNASQEMRSFLMTGILGGFTTFSAFALDAGVLIERHAYAPAAFYVAGSVAGSILALFLGLYLVRLIFA